MTQPELETFLDEHFPGALSLASLTHVAPREVTVRRACRPTDLRPGGTIMGPILMALADTTMYFAILATIGPVVDVVTTNLNMHFLRRPPPRDLVATATLLRLGRRLAMGTVSICSDDDPDPVAHATVSYALPA